MNEMEWWGEAALLCFNASALLKEKQMGKEQGSQAPVKPFYLFKNFTSGHCCHPPAFTPLCFSTGSSSLLQKLIALS